MPPSERIKRFYDKNTKFQEYIPTELYHFFIDYLQHYCQGDTTPKQFRVFLYELRSLEAREITLVNPRGDYEKQRQKELYAKFGDANPDLICLRSDFYKDKSEIDKSTMCGYCKNEQPSLFKVCHEQREEIRKSQKSYLEFQPKNQGDRNVNQTNQKSPDPPSLF